MMVLTRLLFGSNLLTLCIERKDSGRRTRGRRKKRTRGRRGRPTLPQEAARQEEESEVIWPEKPAAWAGAVGGGERVEMRRDGS